MTQLQCKYIVEKKVYFRWLAGDEYLGYFWYTPTTDSADFNIGKIDHYTPIDSTWEEILDAN
jgi:hypothetical protein